MHWDDDMDFVTIVVRYEPDRDADFAQWQPVIFPPVDRRQKNLFLPKRQIFQRLS